MTEMLYNPDDHAVFLNLPCARCKRPYWAQDGSPAQSDKVCGLCAYGPLRPADAEGAA